MNVQQNIHEAFLWTRQIYDESRALLEDAQRLASDHGLKPWNALTTGYGQALTKGIYPFVYLGVSFFYEQAHYDDEAATALFIAIDFHSQRSGPHLLVGSVRHSLSTNVNANLINATARLLGETGYFKTKKPPNGDVVYAHTPANPKMFVGIDEVRHAELPLTFIDTPEKLAQLVAAGVAFVRGDEGPLRAFVKEAVPA